VRIPRQQVVRMHHVAATQLLGQLCVAAPEVCNRSALGLAAQPLCGTVNRVAGPRPHLRPETFVIGIEELRLVLHGANGLGIDAREAMATL
jgi:hypothetical protein